MTGQERLEQLEQAGFSESEIQGYIARQSNRLQQAGFSESEISRHWGQPEEPTHPIQKVGPVAPAIQRMQQPTTGTTAMAEYLESFIKGTTFGAMEPEIADFEPDLEKPKGLEVGKKVAEFAGYGVGMTPIIRMTTPTIQGAIQGYSILRGASPALKAAIQGSVQGGLIMAADAAAKGKPLKTGLIDTGIGAFMFGLFNAGAVKFIDTLTRRGVSPQEAQKLYTDIESLQQNLIRTRLGTVSSKFENYADREAQVLGKSISQFGPIRTTEQSKQVQSELQKVFDVIPPERIQVAQERTSELLRLARQAVTPKPKQDIHRPWLNILKDINTALGRRGAVGTAKLTKEQITARDRLSKDITTIMRNAARTGKNIETYLTDLGYDKVIARELQNIAQTKVETAMPLGKRISDEVKQYVDLSNMAMKKGKPELSERMASKAVKNGEHIKLADGPEVEGIVNQQLANLPKYPKKELPKYAGSINLERQAVSQSAKELELQLSKQIPRSRQTWTETEKEAQKIVGDQKRFQALLKRAAKGGVASPQEALALRQAEVNAIEQLAKIHNSPQREILLKEFQEGLFKSVSTEATAAGRILNIHRKTVAPNKAASAFAKLNRNLTDREWQRFHEANKAFNEGNSRPLFEFADYLEATKDNPKIKDYLYEFWYNSILSGPPTHLVNMGSNTLWQLFQAGVHHPLRAALDPMISSLQGRQREYFMSEILPMWMGMAKGWKRGAKAAGEVLKKGYTLEQGVTKWDIETSQIAGAWARSPHELIRKSAPFADGFLRGLKAMDIWTKSIGFDGQVRALATRKAAQQGLKGEALKKQAMEYAKAPTDLMIEQAGESANYFTFMDAPGAATRHALAIRNMVPLARTQIPFINTIVNLFKRGIEMTPGIGLLPKAGREVLKSPKQAGPKVTDVVAKQIEGLMIASEIAYLYDQGRITGPAPKNAAKKMAFYQAGFQPWSVKLGDNWYSYRRIEPFNTVIGSVAIALQAWEESGEVPPTETILRIGSGVAGNVLDGTYLQGTLALQKAIEYGETNPQRLQNLIDRTMASFMPYSSLQRSLVRATEAYQEGEAYLRKPRGITETVLAQTHTQAKKIRAERNVWGDKVTIPGGPVEQFLPWKRRAEKADKRDKEIWRLGNKDMMPFPGMPSKNFELDEFTKRHLGVKEDIVKLTPEQYDKLAFYTGKLAKKQVDFLINLKGYKKFADTAKGKKIAERIKKAREQGRRIMKVYFREGEEAADSLFEVIYKSLP